MKFFLKLCGLLLLFNPAALLATPTTLFWTPCITDVQTTGTANIDVDNFFTVFNRPGHGQFFLPETGILLGVFTRCDLSAEAGVDYIGGADYPLFFNGKVGMKEGKLFKKAPSFSFGIFNVGTRNGGRFRTNQNILDLIIGKNLPKKIGGGRLFLGAFSGSKAMGKNRQGFMIGYQRQFCSATYCDGVDYFKWVFSADFASGKNTIGGGGFALTRYFSPNIMFQTGPVWFNSAEINGRWKWSIQINITFPVCSVKKCEVQKAPAEKKS